MCTCSDSFIGQTPFVNASINGYDGFSELAQHNSADGTDTATAKDNSLKGWIKTVLPVLDKVAGVTPTTDTPSDAYNYDVNKPATDSSNTVLWVVVGVVVLLIAIWAFVKFKKK